MSLIYGANSITPANARLTNGYTLYDWVMRMGCFPSFWGRSLTGDGKITQDEMEFLKNKNCRVALIVRDLTEAEVSANDGTRSAVKALEAAKKLDIPKNKGIAIFAYIEPEWSVNHNWMISYASNLKSGGYIPGFIGNTDSSLNFNFDRQCSHYVQATRNLGQFEALYWSLAPKYNFDPEKWSTYAPSELLPNDMHLWSYGSIDFHSVHADKTYARDERVLKSFV